MTIDEFKRLKSMDSKTLKKLNKYDLIKEIRKSIPHPDSTVWMQKAIPFKDIANYLSGAYTQIRGFMARMADVDHLRTYGDMYKSLGLNYVKANNEVDFNPSTDESMGVIRFRSKMGDDLIIPFEELVESLDSTFTGNGNGDIVPEYRLNRFRRFLEGELYEVCKDGTWMLRGIYDVIEKKFISVKSED